MSPHMILESAHPSTIPTSCEMGSAGAASALAALSACEGAAVTALLSASLAGHCENQYKPRATYAPPPMTTSYYWADVATNPVAVSPISSPGSPLRPVQQQMQQQIAHAVDSWPQQMQPHAQALGPSKPPAMSKRQLSQSAAARAADVPSSLPSLASISKH